MKYTIRYFLTGKPDQHVRTLTITSGDRESAKREGDKIMRSHRHDLDQLSASIDPA